MTVPATTAFNIYPGSGTAYDFDFPILDESDLLVTHIDTSGVTTTLALTTDYTVAINPDGTGTITTGTSYSSGQIELRRNLQLVQSSRWVNGTDFDVELLETDLDKLMMIIQQQQVVIDQSVQIPQGRGDWITGGEYGYLDVVIAPDLNLYQCVSAHTAGTFTTDLASGLWVIFLRNSGLAFNRILDHQTTGSALAIQLNGQIVVDSSIPQITEGVQVLSIPVTPQAVGNLLMVRFFTTVQITPAQEAAVALFDPGVHATNAIAATAIELEDIAFTPICFEHTWVANSVATRNISIRIGSASGVSTFHAGATAGGTTFFSGVTTTSMMVTEYEVA